MSIDMKRAARAAFAISITYWFVSFVCYALAAVGYVLRERDNRAYLAKIQALTLAEHSPASLLGNDRTCCR